MRSQVRFLFRWADAFCPEDAWYTKDDFEYDERIIETVGYCIHQDRNYYAVAGTYDPTTEQYCSVIMIPRGCVRYVRELDELPDDSSLVGVADPSVRPPVDGTE